MTPFSKIPYNDLGGWVVDGKKFRSTINGETVFGDHFNELGSQLSYYMEYLEGDLVVDASISMAVVMFFTFFSQFIHT